MRRKRFWILLLLLALFVGLFAHPALSESTQEKKVVHVVMDDSGTMGEGSPFMRWTQARYALQVLCGLLNPGDELRVSYLNSKQPQTVDLSPRGIQSSVSSIAARSYGGNTPFTRVREAFKALSTRQDGDDTVQYWLVVITDGQFNNDISDSSARGLRSIFEGYAAQGVGGGHKPLNIIYCTIGANATSIDAGGYGPALAEKRIYCYNAGDSKIVEVMDGIADRISGRSRFTGSALTVLDSRTLQVESGIPLFNFVVLNQNSEAVLQSVSYAEGGELQISRQAAIRSEQGRIALAGSVYTVDNGNDRIRSGVYRLTFSGPVDVNSVAVLFEPALDVRLRHTDLKGIMEEDPFEAEASIYEYGTNTPVPLSQLPARSTLTLTVTRGDGSVLAKDSGPAPKVSVKALPYDSVTVRAVLHVDGFRDMTSTVTFLPEQKPRIAVSAPDDGGTGLKDRTVTVTTEELKHEEKHVDFHVTLNGSSSLTPDQLQAMGLRVQTDLPHRVEYRKGGVLRVIPQYKDGITLDAHPVALYEKSGAQPVETVSVRVIASTYAVQVSPSKPQEIREAKFRDEGKTFTFTLVVDGKKVDASRYDPLTFGELTPGNPLTAELKGEKWEVTARYQPGMALTSYTIAAQMNGAPLQDAAVLTLLPSDYTISLSPEDASRRQSELADKPPVFRATLKEDKKKIDPAGLQVDYGKYPPGTAAVDTDKNELEVTLGGDISLPAGDYPIRVSYQSASGTRQEAVFTLHVAASDFVIGLDPDRQMLFNQPSELENNSQAFRFDITADGRPLTDAEMALVTACAVDPGDTATSPFREKSGYTVTPRVAAGWQPAFRDRMYTVTCTAGSASRTAEFRYSRVDYTVECIGGSGMEIDQTALLGNTRSLRFRVLANGQPLDFNTVNGNYTVSAPGRFARHIALDAQTEPDGTVTVTPASHNAWALYQLHQALIPKGEMPVTVAFRGASGEGIVRITAGGFAAMLLPYLITAGALFILLCYIFKKRFSHRAYIYSLSCRLNGTSITATSPSRKTWDMKKLFPFWQLLWPFGRERVTVKKMRFRAFRWGSRRARESAIEYYVGRKMIVCSIPSSYVNVRNGANVPDPGPVAAIKPGWHTLQDGGALVCYRDRGTAVLYQYKK